jgi:hypothetical protein
LVSPPAVGKSVAIAEVQRLWAKTGLFNIAPAGTTRQGLIDAILEGGDRKDALDFTKSVLVAASEFGVLLTAHDLDFLNTLNNFYDNPEVTEYRTRGTGLIKIDNPHISLIGGTQPKYLGEVFPEAAFGMGFTSRIIMVYAGSPVRTKLFSKRQRDESLWTELVEGLKRLAALSGQMEIVGEVQEEMERWWDEGLPPVPKHHKLQHYNGRRVLHILKLMMISAASDERLTILPEDMIFAKETLLEAEYEMPEIFKEMSSGSSIDVLEELYNFMIRVNVARKGGPVSLHEIVDFLSRMVPASQTKYIIDTMLDSGRMTPFFNEKNPGIKFFKPQARTPINEG